ncbi:hypothetical protein D3C80_1316730 [compost metagenome]
MGETEAWAMAILHRREHRAKEKDGAVRILMVTVQELRSEVFRRAADRLHGADTRHGETVLTLDQKRDLRLLHVFDGEAAVEQADERTDRAGGIVVLRLAEQEGGTAFEIAQVDVVAERRADDAAIGGDGEHHFRLRVVPLRFRVNADQCAAADRGHGLRL